MSGKELSISASVVDGPRGSNDIKGEVLDADAARLAQMGRLSVFDHVQEM